MAKIKLKILAVISILLMLLLTYKLLTITSGETYFKKGEKSFMSATESDVIDHQKLENAISNYEKAIDNGIKNRDVFSNLATSYILLNVDNENAERIYNKGIKIYPNDAEFYFLRANCKKNLKNFKSAFLDYEKCINLGQSKKENFIKEAIYNRGAMQYMLGDYVNADKDWKLAQLKTDYELRTYQDYCQLFK